MPRSKTPVQKSKKKEDTSSLRAIFDQLDVDGSGGVDIDEFTANSSFLGFGNLTTIELHKLFNEADNDGNGIMDFKEFESTVKAARGTASKWANASALAVAGKRYNSILAASDHIFGSIQSAVASSSETSDNGVVKAGASQIVGNIINTVFVMAGSSGLIFGWNQLKNELLGSFFGAFTGGRPIGICILVGALIPWVIAWTRSQPHIGGLILGHEVLDFETKNKASLGQMFLRTFISMFNVLGTCYIYWNLGFLEMNTSSKWQEKITLLNLFAIFMGLIESILILARANSRSLVDTLVGTQIAVRK